jgi:hypothetical protein
MSIKHIKLNFMKNTNFLQIILVAATGGILFSYNALPARGDGGCQDVAVQENSKEGWVSDCQGGFSNAEKCDKKAAQEKEKCESSADKEKPAEKTGERVKDFCRLKDLY